MNRTSLLSALILYSILAFGVVLRLVHSQDYFRFGVDQYYELRVLKNIASRARHNPFRIPLQGQAGSYPYLFGEEKPNSEFTIYNGVLYTYMLLPIALLTNFSPYPLVLLYIFLNSMTILIMFHCGKILIDRRIGYLVALFTASSYWLNAFSRTFWTPSAIPFFVAISLYGVISTFRGDTGKWWIAFLGASAASQVHNSGYIYLLFIILEFIISGAYKKLTKKQWASSLLALIVPLLPTFITEVRSGFQSARALGDIIFIRVLSRVSGSPSLWSMIQILVDIGKEGIRYYGTALGQLPRSVIPIPFIRNIIWGFIILLILPIPYFYIFKKNTSNQNILHSSFRRIYIFFTLWITIYSVVPWAVMHYYNQQNFDITTMLALLPGIPILYLILAVRLRFLLAAGGKLKLFAYTLALIIICINTVNVYSHMWKNSTSEYNYRDMTNAALAIVSDAGGRPYELTVRFHDQEGTEMLYFFETHQLKFPERLNGSYAPRGNNPSERILTNKKASMLYSFILTGDIETVPTDSADVGSFGNFTLYRKNLSSLYK